MEWMAYGTALGLGLLGGGHCVGMCGGIMGALTFAIPESAHTRRFNLLFHYNIGRIGSYTFMGLLLGLLGGFTGTAGNTALRLLAGVLLIAMGLYLAGWWRGLTYVERLGGGLWRYLQPLGKRLMPVKSAPQALLLGTIWGWLPCGLVYSALAYAASQANGPAAAGVMLAFGLGTLPVVMASGLFAERLKALIQKQQIRSVFAILIMVFGGWTLWGSLQHAGHGDHAGHGAHAESAAHSEHGESSPEVMPVPGAESTGAPMEDHHHHH